MADPGSTVSSGESPSSRRTPVMESPPTEEFGPNSFCTRPTPYAVNGSISVRPKSPVPASNVRACSRAVKAVSPPTESPFRRRPVSFAAPRIVALVGRSTKSPDAKPRAFGEEGPALVEEGLERREVHFGGIRLDLTEVGVHRRVEREVGSEPHLEVGAGAHRHVAAVAERIACRLIIERSVARDVGNELHAARRLHALDAAQGAEARRPPGLPGRNDDPVDVLVHVRHPAIDLDTPGLRPRGAEAQLRERDPQFGDPAGGIDRRLRLPDGIPRHVAAAFGIARV